MVKHTPGPWTLDFDDDDGRDDSVPVRGAGLSSGWVAVAYVPIDYANRAEREANARLIAAAPAMYEALKALHDWVLGYAQDDVSNARFHSTGGFGKMEAARAAIAKAEGERRTTSEPAANQNL